MTVHHIFFGDGSLIVNNGKYGGEPAVFIEAAPVPGAIGENANDALPRDRITDGGTVLTFKSAASLNVLIEELLKLKRIIEPVLGPSEYRAMVAVFNAFNPAPQKGPSDE